MARRLRFFVHLGKPLADICHFFLKGLQVLAAPLLRAVFVYGGGASFNFRVELFLQYPEPVVQGPPRIVNLQVVSSVAFVAASLRLPLRHTIFLELKLSGDFCELLCSFCRGLLGFFRILLDQIVELVERTVAFRNFSLEFLRSLSEFVFPAPDFSCHRLPQRRQLRLR